MRIKYFTALQKVAFVQFSKRHFRARRAELLNGFQHNIKIVLNETKAGFILVLVKPFSRQSFSKNYFSSENDRVVLTETAS